MLLIVILNGWIISISVFRCYNPYDMGFVLDSSWRMLSGQKIYSDFIYHNGPVFLYMNNIFFHLFGFGKEAVLINLVVVSSVIIIFTFYVFSRLLPAGLVLLTTALCAASFYIPHSFPWYTPAAHFWGIGAVGIAILSIYRKIRISSFGVHFFIGICVICSLMSKINIGTGYFLMFLFFSVFYPSGGDLRSKASSMFAYFAGCSFCFLLIVLPLESPQRFFHIVFDVWPSSQVWRFESSGSLTSWLPKSYAILALMVFISAWRSLHTKSPLFFIFWGCIMTAVLDLRTSMAGPANTQLRGVIVGLAFLLIYEEYKNALGKQRMFQRILIFVLMILSCSFAFRSINVGTSRQVWMYASVPMGDYPLRTSSFKGWMFGHEDGEFIDDALAFIEKNIPADQTIWILSDMEILYGLAKRESYRHIPVHWEAGIYNSEILRKEMYQSLFVDNPPDWIFATPPLSSDKGLFSSFELALPKKFKESYVLVKKWPNHVLVKRK